MYPTFHFSLFNCCFNAVLSLDKGVYPENSHVVLCHSKLAFFYFHVFGFLFLTACLSERSPSTSVISTSMCLHCLSGRSSSASVNSTQPRNLTCTHFSVAVFSLPCWSLCATCFFMWRDPPFPWCQPQGEATVLGKHQNIPRYCTRVAVNSCPTSASTTSVARQTPTAAETLTAT